MSAVMRDRYCFDQFDPDCVDGVPLDFERSVRFLDECEFDDALALDLLPPHEIAQHKAVIE